MQQSIQARSFDTDFVEVFDNDTMAAFDHRQYTRDLARERQHMLAGELSRLDAAEYQDDILEHMMRMDVSLFIVLSLSDPLLTQPQAETLPDVDSIDIQPEIKWFMRPYLLDFVIEAHSVFGLLPESLFLAVNLLDRYCSKREVFKRHYQLVSCASLLIAAKYGDKKERVPTIKELRSMCGSLYDDDMFLQMEWHILSTLGWVIGHSTVDSFLRLAVKDSVYDPEAENLALFISEISLFHREFVSKLSSTVALSSLALARHILGRPQARQNEYAAHYCPSTLVELSQKLHQPSQILSRKYASSRYSSVSRILEDFLTAQAPVVVQPPTPLLEQTPPSSTKPEYVDSFGYSTPQKPQQGPTVMAYGYPTPPITPEDQFFKKGSPVPQQYGPPTPTPNGTAHPTYLHGYQQQFQPQQSGWNF